MWFKNRRQSGVNSSRTEVKRVSVVPVAAEEAVQQQEDSPSPYISSDQDKANKHSGRSISSPFSHCPPEIWRPILFYVVGMPFYTYDRRALDSGAGKRGWIDYVESDIAARVREAILVGRSLMCVCRSWKDIMQPLLLRNFHAYMDDSFSGIPTRPGLVNFANLTRGIKGNVAAQYIRTALLYYNEDRYALKSHEWPHITRTFALCTSLEYLHLTIKSTTRNIVNDELLSQFFAILPKDTLKKLKISGAMALGTSALITFLVPFLSSCLALVHLDITSYRSLATSTTALTSLPAFETSLHRGLPIEILSVSCKFGDMDFEIFPPSSLPRLWQLNISDLASSDWSYDNVRKFLGRHCAQLSCLSLDSEHGFPVPRALALMTLCPNLEDLLVTITGDPTPPTQPFRRLRRLGLQQDFAVRGEGPLDSLAAAFFIRTTYLPLFPHLAVIRWEGFKQSAVSLLDERLLFFCRARDIRLEDWLGNRLAF